LNIYFCPLFLVHPPPPTSSGFGIARQILLFCRCSIFSHLSFFLLTRLGFFFFSLVASPLSRWTVGCFNKHFRRHFRVFHCSFEGRVIFHLPHGLFGPLSLFHTASLAYSIPLDHYKFSYFFLLLFGVPGTTPSAVWTLLPIHHRPRSFSSRFLCVLFPPCCVRDICHQRAVCLRPFLEVTSFYTPMFFLSLRGFFFVGGWFFCVCRTGSPPMFSCRQFPRSSLSLVLRNEWPGHS